ncbi:588_t:CDS:2, partial [Paraglomus brasilianum]
TDYQPLEYCVDPLTSDLFRFDLDLKEPILIPRFVFDSLPRDRSNVLPDPKIILSSMHHCHLSVYEDTIIILRNIKDGTSEDALHFRDGSILHIISATASSDPNIIDLNHSSNSTLKRKRVDAHIGNIPVVIVEEKQLDTEVGEAKLDIYRKFDWSPHYRNLPYVIAIAVGRDNIVFSKFTRAKHFIDELSLNLSLIKDRAAINTGRYCQWAFKQVGPEPLYPFGKTIDRLPADSGIWGTRLTINYSSVLKTFYSMESSEIQRVHSFYARNTGIPFLEKALRNETKNNELHLELTPVGLMFSPTNLATLQTAMYCFLHVLAKVHQNGWSVIDIRWPNTIEYNGCYYIIDAGEFAQEHGHPIHSKVLKKFDQNSLLSRPAHDVYMVKEMMKEVEEIWRYNSHAIDFMRELDECYRKDSLESVLNCRFLTAPTRMN